MNDQNHIDAIRSVTQWPIIRQLVRQLIRIRLGLDPEGPLDLAKAEALMEEVLE